MFATRNTPCSRGDHEQWRPSLLLNNDIITSGSATNTLQVLEIVDFRGFGILFRFIPCRYLHHSRGRRLIWKLLHRPTAYIVQATTSSSKIRAGAILSHQQTITDRCGRFDQRTEVSEKILAYYSGHRKCQIQDRFCCTQLFSMLNWQQFVEKVTQCFQLLSQVSLRQSNIGRPTQFVSSLEGWKHSPDGSQ